MKIRISLNYMFFIVESALRRMKVHLFARLFWLRRWLLGKSLFYQYFAPLVLLTVHKQRFHSQNRF